MHYLLHIVFEFLLEQNANQPIYLFLFDSTNPKSVTISLLTQSPTKYFFEIMKFGLCKNHKNFLKIYLYNKKDHKFLWERGSRIEKYSSSFASNSSWLTGILKMSDEKISDVEKMSDIGKDDRKMSGNWQLWVLWAFLVSKDQFSVR